MNGLPEVRAPGPRSPLASEGRPTRSQTLDQSAQVQSIPRCAGHLLMRSTKGANRCALSLGGEEKIPKEHMLACTTLLPRNDASGRALRT